MQIPAEPLIDVVKNDRHLKLVFWVEDVETKEIVLEKSQIVAVFKLAEFDKISASIRETFPSMAPSEQDKSIKTRSLGWGREIIDAACNAMQRGFLDAALAHLGLRQP